MTFDMRFFRAAAVCSLLTVPTTLAIHLLPELFPAAGSFEEQLALARNPLYLTHRWIVVFHCLLVAAAMLGLGASRLHSSPGLIALGFLGYFVFAFTELLRSLLVLFAYNGWKRRYLETSDEGLRVTLRASIESFRDVNVALFFLFILGFCLGNLFYGLALRRGSGLEGVVGVALLVWSGFGLNTLLEEATGAVLLGPYLGWVGFVYQPLARLLVGVWLWRAGPVTIGSSSP